MYASPPKSHHLKCQGQSTERSQEPEIIKHRFWRSWSMYGAYNECVRRLTFYARSESYRGCHDASQHTRSIVRFPTITAGSPAARTGSAPSARAAKTSFTHDGSMACTQYYRRARGRQEQRDECAEAAAHVPETRPALPPSCSDVASENAVTTHAHWPPAPADRYRDLL
jgi:hypothetical protein